MNFMRTSVSLLIKIKMYLNLLWEQKIFKNRLISLVGFFQAEQLKQVIQAA